MVRSPRLDNVRRKVQTRGDITHVCFSYLSRVQPAVYSMHHALKAGATDALLFETQVRHYVIALVGHLETYFRDIFRLALENDPQLCDRVVREHKLKLPAPEKLTRESVEQADVIVESFTMQSAGSIEAVMDLLFQPTGFRSSVEQSEISFALPARAAIMHGFPTSAFPNWWDDLTRIFELRHEYSHDANSRCQLRRSEIAGLEALALFLPQYVSYMLKSPSARLLVTGDQQPVILLTEDLLATDWELAD